MYITTGQCKEVCYYSCAAGTIDPEHTSAAAYAYLLPGNTKCSVITRVPQVQLTQHTKCRSWCILLPGNTKCSVITCVPQVQIDPAYQAPQLLHSINKVDIKALICAEFYKNNSCYQILRAVVPELDDYPASGVEISGSKTPSVKTLIMMSDKHYRWVLIADVCDILNCMRVRLASH